MSCRGRRRENQPADLVGGYFHVVIRELAAPDAIHYRLDFLSEGFRDVCLAFVGLIDGWRGDASVRGFVGLEIREADIVSKFDHLFRGGRIYFPCLADVSSRSRIPGERSCSKM